MAKPRKQKTPSHSTIRAWRPVDYKSKELEEFTNQVGRAIAGAGTTRSLGSMALTLLGGAEFERLKSRMTAVDQRRLDVAALAEKIKANLKDRPKFLNLQIEGIGLFGKKWGRQWEPVARLGFSAILGDNSLIAEDLEAINTVFSNENLPLLSTDRHIRPHIAFGDIFTDHITRGQGENPHLLIPRGVFIPDTIPLYRAQADEITYNSREDN